MPHRTTVTLTPWIGTVILPNVVEKELPQAEIMLDRERLRFQYGPPKIDPVSSPHERGTVAEQSPAAG